MILVVSDLWVPFPGGAERLMFNLARHLHRAGEDVGVLCGYHNVQEFDGPPIVGLLGLPDTEQGAKLLETTIAAMSVDVILTHHYWAFTFADVLHDCGVPVVQVVLNGYRLPFAAMAVFISEYVRAGMDDRVADMTILPPAFDDVRAESHGDAIGFIKPLHHKGVDLVYDIARAMPDRKFVVLRGEWQDIETIVELPNVEYMEPVVDIRDFYSRVRLVLMPSLSEDAGTVAQECAVNGIPCISSDVGGLPETNRGGVLLSSRDPVTWAQLIEELDDPPTYDAMNRNQQRGLNLIRQQRALDEFAARVRALQR